VHRLICFREIFGPVLPLMPVADLDEALHHINAGWVFCGKIINNVPADRFFRENPLALYVFSQDAAFKRKGVSLI
jgi:acyl-CoA reductase-like NAD-dependent aldehyde dehydrogenase